MKTKFDLAVWRNAEDGETYAFPIGAKDVLGGVIYPVLGNKAWTYQGTMPKGCPVTDVRAVKGDRVTCKLNGATVNTANWAVDG